MSSLAENLAEVREKIHRACEKSNRPPESVTLVAVTKTVPAEKILEATNLGLTHFGENYVQEALPKIQKINAASSQKLSWHFIGGLQSNKVRSIAGHFDWIHSLDRISLAEELEKRKVAASLCIEVNAAHETTKGGLPIHDVRGFVQWIAKTCPSLKVRGLMTFPPYSENQEDSRKYFKALREIKEKLNLQELSMGVSHDYEVAIEEGATMVRLGTALFGER